MIKNNILVLPVAVLRRILIFCGVLLNVNLFFFLYESFCGCDIDCIVMLVVKLFFVVHMLNFFSIKYHMFCCSCFESILYHHLLTGPASFAFTLTNWFPRCCGGGLSPLGQQ